MKLKFIGSISKPVYRHPLFVLYPGQVSPDIDAAECYRILNDYPGLFEAIGETKGETPPEQNKMESPPAYNKGRGKRK